MKVKHIFFAILVTVLALVTQSVFGAVDTAKIDEVRNKEVLNNEDLEIIDEFVAEAVQDLLESRDFTSVAKTRTVILSRRSTQGQYAEQFSESTYKYISEALRTAGELTPEDYKHKMLLNLLVLVDELEDVRLANLAVGMVKNENALVCYWAVHCITNPSIIEQLNSDTAANQRLAAEIVEQLKNLVDECGPETMVLMAKFAAEVDISGGEDLLLRIADMRISKYADWTVDYELLDATVLRLLCDGIFSGNMNKSAVGRRFGQLYSYAIQRYVKGKEILSVAQKSQLASVLVETEKSCISRLMGRPQAVIKKAIEQNDYNTLLQEHSRLLGDEIRVGQLSLKLSFDYGKTGNGIKRTTPLVLPEPPKELIIEY